MKSDIRNSIILILFFTILCGVIYPLLITIIAKLCFPYQAEGSIIQVEGKKVGSYLIGQSFEKEDSFWGRPSETQYRFSVASNRAIKNETYQKEKQKRREFLKQTSYNNKEVPEDLLTYSASNVDPNITVEAAYFQVDRIALKRKKKTEEIEKLINEHSINYGILGTRMVNVLELNLALDKLEKR